MSIYVAFLRGINVGGKNKLKMADLKISLTKAGFKSVQSYIQSGNLIFSSDEPDRSLLQKKMEAVIRSDFGYEVAVLVTTGAAIKTVIERCPFLDVAELKNLYFCLPFQKPEAALRSSLMPENYPNEIFQITENCIYLNCTKGAAKAKLNNNVIEQKLKLTATTRNLNTLNKMVVLAEAASN